MNIIVIGGAYRSGSTWMFNAVRLLLIHAGQRVEWGSWRGEYGDSEALPGCDFLIVKEHKWLGDLAQRADIVFTSYRDWADAAESWYRFEGKRLSVQQELVRKGWLYMWRNHERHVWEMPYRLTGTREAFNEIALHLPADTWQGQDAAWQELKAIKSPTIGQDDDTLMFANHITA